MTQPSVAVLERQPDLTPYTPEQGAELISQVETYLGKETGPQSLVREAEAIISADEAAKRRLHTFLGRASMHCEVVSPKKTNMTLAEAIDGTAAGDKEAEKIFDINAGSATIEATFKQRHRTIIRKKRTPSGELMQYGLTTDQMQYNSLVFRPDRPDELKAFTLIEAVNGFREEELMKLGVLKDHYIVTASCVPDGMSQQMIEDDGFFKSMTFSLQGSTEEANVPKIDGDKSVEESTGKDVITESIFAPGTSADQEASFEERTAKRFDLAAIGRVYEKFGLKAPKTALELLRRPLIVHRRLLPNGMVDFLRMVDTARDELENKIVDRPVEQYIKIITDSQEREASMENTKARIKAEMLTYAGKFTHPLQAIQLLWNVVKVHVVKESLTNKLIDPTVFGAGKQVAKARYYLGIGDRARAERWMRAAQRVAKVYGCGGRSKNSAGPTLEELALAVEREPEVDEGESEEEASTQQVPDYLDCPECGIASPKDEVVHENATHPELSYWACPCCNYTIDVCTGAVLKSESKHVSELLGKWDLLLEMAGVTPPLSLRAE